jgi:opacity protein-like surface antigen
MSKTLIGGVAAAALTLGALAASTTATTVAPAEAAPAPVVTASIGVTDPADVDHGVDLRAVRVVNGDRAVRIVLNHADLRRSPRSGAGGAVYLDTDAADRGPELVFVGGYYEGTDYQLLHTEGFGRRNWGAPVDGRYLMTLDYDKDQTRMRISRAAVGTDGAVRVAVRVAGDRPDGTSVVDWLGAPRSFTSWVARG